MGKGKLARATKDQYTLAEIERGVRNKELLYTYAESGDLDAVHVIIDSERAINQAGLTELQQRTLDYVWKDNKTLAETGAILGVTPQGVKFNLGLAKVKIQKILDKWAYMENVLNGKGDNKVA